MKVDKKLIRDAFAQLFIHMFNNDADGIELTFDFNKCIAKFKVDLVEVKKKS